MRYTVEIKVTGTIDGKGLDSDDLSGSVREEVENSLHLFCDFEGEVEVTSMTKTLTPDEAEELLIDALQKAKQAGLREDLVVNLAGSIMED